MTQAKLNLTKVAQEMKVLRSKVDSLVSYGLLTSEVEVSPISFLQTIEYGEPTPGVTIAPSWRYHQFWVDKSPKEIQDAVVGGFLNETCGRHKIIGIFNVPGAMVLTE